MDSSPALELNLGCGNYATHKLKNREWLAGHPRFYLHFTGQMITLVNLAER